MTATTRTKQDVLNLLSENHARIEAFGVGRIGLFGSFVRNEQGIDSDIDLLVEFRSGDKSFDNFIKLSFFLEELFQRRVELVTTEGLSPYVGPHILAEVEYATSPSA
jgi:predicted nucleotidyltransferase